MQQNHPLTILVASSIVFIIIVLGSLPGVQLSISKLLGLSEISTYITSKSKSANNTNKLEKVKVSRVIDGDTVVLTDGRTIRYLNIDTPETKKANTPIMCFGPEASEFNKSIVEGREINILADKELTDKYGRSLRFVFLIGKDTENINQSVNAELVTRGFARSSIFKPNDTYEKQFNGYQYKAQQDKIGVWGCPKPFVE